MATLRINNPVRDFPLAECRTTVRKLIEDGATVWQKFTCDQCGDRQKVDDPNILYPFRECTKCGHVTDIEKRGCNYVVAMSL